MACFASFQMFASFFFSLPKWLALHLFKNVCIIFLFVAQMGLVSLTKKRFASLFFSLPKWLALHFQNVCIIFLFVAQVACFAFSKCLHHFSFRYPNGLFWDLRGSIRILVGGPWGPIGNSLGSLPLGFFLGVPLFWDFGNTLKWSFLKVDPVLNQYGSFISWFWVSWPHVQSYRGSNSTQLSEIFIFIWAFTFASSLTFFPLLLKFKGTLVNLWFLFFDLFLNKVCFVFHVFAQSMRV